MRQGISIAVIIHSFDRTLGNLYFSNRLLGSVAPTSEFGSVSSGKTSMILNVFSSSFAPEF